MNEMIWERVETRHCHVSTTPQTKSCTVNQTGRATLFRAALPCFFGIKSDMVFDR